MLIVEKTQIEGTFREFSESDKSQWVQFKDRAFYMCLVSTVAASWSLTQEVAGSKPFDDIYFSENLRKKGNLRENSIVVNDFVAKKSTLFKTMFVLAGTQGCARFPEIL